MFKMDKLAFLNLAMPILNGLLKYANMYIHAGIYYFLLYLKPNLAQTNA